MTPEARTTIRDFVVWFRHVDNTDLRRRMESLGDEEEISLEVGSVVGRWQRMKTGNDGRKTPGIKPIGPMKEVWAEWYRDRRGSVVTIRPVSVADDVVANASSLMTEWSSPEDDDAFADL